jgi:hypothetical protein
VTVPLLCLDERLSLTDPEIERAIDQGLQETLGVLGIGAVPDGGPCDATLAITLTGKALAAQYPGAGSCYTGYEMDGTVTLRGEGRPPVTSAIEVRQGTPFVTTRCPQTPRESNLCDAAARQIFRRVVHLWDPSEPPADPTGGPVSVLGGPVSTPRPLVGGRISDQAFVFWCAPIRPMPEEPTAVPTAGATTGFGDGTHKVGIDVQPGTYRSPGGEACYWERLRGFSGDPFADTLASGQDQNYVVVAIDAADKGFRSAGCGTWSADLSRVTESDTTFGPGMFIVGTDIPPGTYESSKGPCQWQRLSGFGGTLEDQVAHYGPDDTGTALVTILPSDQGFASSESCGTWTRRP